MSSGRFSNFCLSLLECLRICPRRDRDGNVSSQPQTVNLVVGFLFLINYELGTGFLGIPFAFFHAGLLTGIITLTVATFLAWNAAIWVVEVMARAQAIVAYEENPSEMPKFEVSLARKFEFSELCAMFLGQWAKYAFLLFISAYTFLACLAYATVAGSAWSINLPMEFGAISQCNNTDFHLQILPTDITCRNAYWFCLFLFACIVVPLSMIQLREQMLVQIMWSLLRFIALGTILLFCLANLITTQNICNCDDPWEANTTEDYDETCNVSTTFTEITTSFDPRAWFVSVPVIATALNFHQGIPALTHPVKNKKHLGSLLHALMFVISSLYMLLGVILSLWWKDCVMETCTLNWGPLTNPYYDLSLRMVAYFIMLFPSIDVISIYPLIVLTMVNNMYLVLFCKDSAEASNSRKGFIILLTMKFVAAILPITIAMAVSNLVTVLKYAGLAGIFLVFFFPTLLQISSQWVCKKKFAHLLLSQTSVQELHESSTTSCTNNNNHHEHNNNHEDEDFPLIPSREVKPSSLYMTPYSSIFSHWPVAMVLSIFQLALFILASLGVFLPISIFRS